MRYAPLNFGIFQRLTRPQCSWNPDTEASRPFTKQYIESLRVKVKSLESQIAELQNLSLTPSAGPHPNTPASSSLSQESLEDFQIPPSPHTSLSDPLSSIINPEFLNSSSFYSSGSRAFPSLPAFEYQYIFNIDLSLPFERQTPETQASLSCQWNRHLPNLGRDLSRIEHDVILSRYFNHGTSWLSGLVPSLFLRDMINYLSPPPTTTATHMDNYSPLIHCSLMASASALSEDTYIRAKEVRVKFATQAKNWLFDQFGNFHPTLLPSLALLAEYHTTIGERHTGYMYLGMGVRAARTVPISANNLAYTWYSWSIYVQEAFSALESGRPNQMLPPRVPIDYPTEHSGDYSSLEAETFVRTCKLAVIAMDINGNTSNDSSSIAELQSLLDAWYNLLPHRLLIHQHAAFTHPHVFCLHIAYWWITLRLHFPLYRKARTEDSDVGSDEDRSVSACNRATDVLVELFGEFHKRYNLRSFPENLLQAITLCGDTLLFKRNLTLDEALDERVKAQEGIDSCVRALQTVGETWSHALNLAVEFQARVAS
ncbi:hypothetical protein RSOLAG22IIIB_11701 [Rhizoctonia solani]|uniref:Transcription factor domain-containing protein n=1 Tax=Rhizoctonia solani TaxID=456999 RepID=A0A0K6G9T0_9AGAM|nr:hypothetical protein RSOLAG22IIIB_11701 [Rhizoctonia solani]